MTIIGYVRVSTEKQAGEVQTSLADQEAAIERLAARLDGSVSAWYRDEGASGATVEGRPAFRELLAYCEAHRRSVTEPGYVLVLNDSRFGRFPDPDQSAALRFQLREAGWLVRFAENDDSDDLTTRSVMRAIGSSGATQYRLQIQANARRGMRGTAGKGYWTREAPFGYRRRVVYPEGRERTLDIGTPKASDEKVALTPHDVEAAIVLWAFEAYASGEVSLEGLARALTQRAPGRKWSKQTARAVLLNPAYAGDVLSGQRSSGEYGQRDAHPAIVTRDVFAAVAARIAENRATHRSPDTAYLLTGLVLCSQCGAPYVGGGGGRNRRDPTKAIRFYKCGSVIRRGVKCPGPVGTITRHILEGAVLDALAHEIGKPSFQRRIVQEIDRALAARAETFDERSAALSADITRLERRRERLIELLADGTLSRDEAAPQLTRIRLEFERLRTAQQALRFQGAAARAVRAERDRIVKLIADFPALARRLEGPALRELILPWLEAATFDKSKRELTLSVRKVPDVTLLASSLPGQD